ncbi:MAG: hypothetical protein MRZ74_02670 [Blautia sp.]|nr:hypothetical protein [Blautia sp.]
MLCCCKECKFNHSHNKSCSFLSARLKLIKCCPMMMQDELLNDAERYMKENDPKLFMRYIIKETGMGFNVGDLLSVLDYTFFWHSYGTRSSNPKYLKISKDLGNGNYECFDPFYDYKFEAFSEYYESVGFQTNLTPDDFADAENDFWQINPNEHGSDIGVYLFPISKKQEMISYLQKRKRQEQRCDD